MLNLVVDKIYEREPAIASADMLLEFAERTARGRHLRVNRKGHADFLRPEGGIRSIRKLQLSGRGESPSIPRQTCVSIWISGMAEPKPPTPTQLSG